MTRGPRRLFVVEPPAIYLQRPPLVVDSSLLCALLFDEPERADAEQHLSGKNLLAPRLLDHEVVNVAVKKQRLGMPTAAVERALADYVEQGIEFHDTDPRMQFELARRYELSGHDAAYLCLAGQFKVPLLTFDRRLADAAQRHLAALE